MALVSNVHRHSSPATASSISAESVAVVFLRLPAVSRVTGLSRSTIYRLVADRRFPRPVQLAPRAVAWRSSDIVAWGEARPETDR
jgi:prophage regulatory protein